MKRGLLMGPNGKPIALISSDALSVSELRELLDCNNCSYWLKHNHAELMDRDPLDALKDAAALYHLMVGRWNQIIH